MSELENIFYWGMMSYGIKKPEREYQFHPDRKWRLDFAWPELHVAVEIEGGIFVHGRHTQGSGYLNDLEKYNTATLMGWRILRFADNYITGRNQKKAMCSAGL